jgi:hypothetical protein
VLTADLAIVDEIADALDRFAETIGRDREACPVR